MRRKRRSIRSATLSPPDELPSSQRSVAITSLTESDGPSIDQVGVQVSSTATETSISSLCLTKIEFGN